MKKVRVDIHGSCVTRDVFSYDDCDAFKVCVYIARNSIFSLFTPSVDYKKIFNLSEGYSDRMVKWNCEKNVLGRFEKQPADFFIMDLIDERFWMQEIEGCYITWTPQCRRNNVAGIKENLFHARSLPRKKIEEILLYYCDRILDIYPRERIIVHKAYFTPLYKDKEGNIKMFPEKKWQEYQELNDFIDGLYSLCIDYMKCHYISQLPILFADEKNKWTLAPMHYVPEEYIHVLREIRKYIASVIQEGNKENKNQEKRVSSIDEASIKWLGLTRIDMKNQGEGNDLTVTLAEEAECYITKPKWFAKDGIGYVLETSNQHLVLELECHGAGNLRIGLRGIDRRNSVGIRLPFWVDYTRLAVNKEVIFWELNPQWHDRPYIYNRQVEDGEKIQVEISWTLHEYKGDELAQLLSLWSAVPDKD